MVWLHPTRVFLLILACTVFATPAAALDIDFLDVYWLTDRQDGTPFTNPYAFEIDVGMLDDSGLARIEVVPPAGGHAPFDLVPDGPLYYTLPPSVSGGYASSAALFADFPIGNWTFRFRDGADAILDSYSANLGSAEVMDFVDITNPTDGGTIPIDASVDWLDCSACDGSFLIVIAVDSAADTDVDELITNDLSVSSWSPSGLVEGTDYDFETILSEYSHANTTEVTAGADSFFSIAGYESLNFVSATAVPEPSATLSLLFGIGLIRSLAGRRPERIGISAAPIDAPCA